MSSLLGVVVPASLAAPRCRGTSSTCSSRSDRPTSGMASSAFLSSCSGCRRVRDGRHPAHRRPAVRRALGHGLQYSEESRTPVMTVHAPSSRPWSQDPSPPATASGGHHSPDGWAGLGFPSDQQRMLVPVARLHDRPGLSPPALAERTPGAALALAPARKPASGWSASIGSSEPGARASVTTTNASTGCGYPDGARRGDPTLGADHRRSGCLRRPDLQLVLDSASTPTVRWPCCGDRCGRHLDPLVCGAPRSRLPAG